MPANGPQIAVLGGSEHFPSGYGGGKPASRVWPTGHGLELFWLSLELDGGIPEGLTTLAIDLRVVRAVFP